MPNWKRAHDAWIAEKCEGWSDTPLCGWPHYSTDNTAAIRAAEAWRKLEPGRWYEITSSCNMTTRTSAGYARCFSPMNMLAGEADGDFALAQALYRATGGAE
jgi:hypothetical protein